MCLASLAEMQLSGNGSSCVLSMMLPKSGSLQRRCGLANNIQGILRKASAYLLTWFVTFCLVAPLGLVPLALALALGDLAWPSVPPKFGQKRTNTIIACSEPTTIISFWVWGRRLGPLSNDRGLFLPFVSDKMQ